MFDCVENNFNTRERLVKLIRDIKIIHHCVCCKNPIETWWDFSNELDGKWIAMETNFSELFGVWVALPNKILCNKCFGTGEWKRRGIKWK